MVFRLIAGILALWLTAIGGAQAEPRLALVIGNGAYRQNPALANPVADARLIARSLAGLGFRVTTLTDADQTTMKQAIADFGRGLRASGPDTVGLFYYAGHGVQAHQVNYLIPVDGSIRDEADLDLVGVEGRWVLRQMESARNVTNIVILDACRDNPFAAAGVSETGLARMDAPTGTFIAYATAPGAAAKDGTTGNSPFTAALARTMNTPGLPIEQVMKQVRVEVLRETRGAQTPWDTSSLVREFVFRPAAAPAAQDEAAMWQSARASRDPVQLVQFLRSHPGSPHAAEARALLNTALAGTPPVPPPAPPPSVPNAGGAIRFRSPLTDTTAAVQGRSIEQLANGVPSFAPIPGLDAAAWQGQHCSACHQWTRVALCTQGRFYTGKDDSRTMANPHPYGGGLKAALKAWAGAGCP